VTSTRKQRKQQARWDTETRQWATETAKALTLTLYQDTDPAVAPYNVGVVLDPGEKPWVQIPARCSLDRPQPAPPGQASPPEPPVTAWLVTNQRVVGRYSNGDLRGWRWDWAVGCLTDLTPGHEYVHLDCRKENYPPRIDWYGPGVAPLAVAAVYHLHGLQALLDHPGLAALRTGVSGKVARPRAEGASEGQGAVDLADRRPGPSGELGPVPLRDRWGL
jgi:hypothetical protein